MAAPEQKMRVVFMGTPDFAATVLRHVAAWPGCEVVAAYCQPDRPAGRGHKLQPPAVKVLAQELDIPVFQPLNFKDEADRAALAGLRPDALVVAAYGLILPQSVLDIPTIGPFNVHGSLLPQYRGAAPIQRAIMDGNHLTGITIMRMERGLDTGPMLLQRALGIGIDDTAATMHDELADLGGRLMVEVLRQYADGDPSTWVDGVPPKPGAQPGTGAETGAGTSTGTQTGTESGGGTGGEPAAGTGTDSETSAGESGSSSSAPTEDIPAPDTGDGAADGPAQSSPEEDHYGYEIPAGKLPPGY